MVHAKLFGLGAQFNDLQLFKIFAGSLGDGRFAAIMLLVAVATIVTIALLMALLAMSVLLFELLLALFVALAALLVGAFALGRIGFAFCGCILCRFAFSAFGLDGIGLGRSLGLP